MKAPATAALKDRPTKGSHDGGPAVGYAQAELVRVEPVSLGVFTKPLKVNEFVLRPLR